MYWQYVETVKLQSKWHTLSSAKTQFSTSHEVHNRVTPPTRLTASLKKCCSRQKLHVKAQLFLIVSRSTGFVDSQYPSSLSLGQRDFSRSLQSWVSK